MAAEKKCIGHGHHEDVPTEFDQRASPAPRGTEPCDECGVLAERKGNHYSVHFPTLTAVKPCMRSWPPTKRAA